MSFLFDLSRLSRRRAVFLACVAAAALAGVGLEGRAAREDVLHIGTSGTLTAGASGDKEKGALATLKSFIKTEAGMTAEILRQKNWQELAEKMSKGDLSLGVFQGYEFAWAQENQPGLKPLVLAVNVYRYPVVYIVARAGDKVGDFAGLQGQAISLPSDDGPARFFVKRQVGSNGKKLDAFFSKIVPQTTVEDALDDVVDGVVQATAVERASLEAYKKRKPGRFKQLKAIAESPPLPPAVVAYRDKALDDATLRRFQDGLLKASRKEDGQMMLTLFRLSGFEKVPADFAKVLADTRKAFPPTSAETK